MCRRAPIGRADECSATLQHLPTRAGTSAPKTKPLRAILLICVGRLLIPITDAGAKLIDGKYSMWQAVWSRYAFGIVIVLPLAMWRNYDELVRPARPTLLLLRGALHLTAVILNFTALQYLPLADAAAIFYINPVLVVLLSALLLRERVARRRWAACAVGLFAVFIISKPGFAVFEPASLLMVATALCSAGGTLVVRHLSIYRTPPSVMLTYQSILGASLLTLLLPSYFAMPATALDAAVMVAIGAVGTLTHFLMILAMQMAEASLLAPFLYVEMVSQVGLGYLVFGELPDAATDTGILLMVLVGVYLGVTESQAASSVPAAQLVCVVDEADASFVVGDGEGGHSKRGTDGEEPGDDPLAP